MFTTPPAARTDEQESQYRLDEDTDILAIIEDA
jgi:hypothetical protein